MRYSKEFSTLVVKQFLEVHTRGWHIVQEMFPKLNKSRVIYIFMCSQSRWNHFKKTVKLADKLAKSPWYRDNKPLLFYNVRSQVPYFGKLTQGKVESKYHSTPKDVMKSPQEPYLNDWVDHLKDV